MRKGLQVLQSVFLPILREMHVSYSEIVGVAHFGMAITKTGTSWKGLKVELPISTNAVQFICFRWRKSIFVESVRQLSDNERRKTICSNILSDWRTYVSNLSQNKCLEILSKKIFAHVSWKILQKRVSITIFNPVFGSALKNPFSRADDSSVTIRFLSKWFINPNRQEQLLLSPPQLFIICQFFSLIRKINKNSSVVVTTGV